MGEVRDGANDPAGAVTEDAGNGMTHVDGGRTTTARLRFARMGKAFPNGAEACRDVFFELGTGEFVSLVGPSGFGKSTLLRIASGLTAPTAGQLVRPSESMGFVFQDPTLLPWRTVQANVELFLELRRVPKRERARIANEALALVGLTDYAQLLPRQLSGGMRMRVSLADPRATRRR